MTLALISVLAAFQTRFGEDENAEALGFVVLGAAVGADGVVGLFAYGAQSAGSGAFSGATSDRGCVSAGTGQ
jgi:hypothetical protein